MQQVRIVIENVTPRVDCGRFAAKAVVGDKVEVAADIWKDGHELLRAAVRWRKLGPDELTHGALPAVPDPATRLARVAPVDRSGFQRSLVRDHQPA